MIDRFKLVSSNEQALIEQLKIMLSLNPAVEVIARPWKDKRSISASAQIQVWYKQIADHDGEDVRTIEFQCKRMFGLPILMDSHEYGEKIAWTLEKLDFFNWPYEKQCGYMELLPVTRLFNTRQHNKYRDDMQAFYAKNGVIIDYINS